MNSRKVFTVSVFVLLCAFAFAQEDISNSPSTGCGSLAVKFAITGIDTSTFTTILWDFGNDIPPSNKKNPDTVYFSNPGVYEIEARIGALPPVYDTVYVYEQVPATFLFDSVDALTFASVPQESIQGLDNFSYSWEYFRADTLIRDTTRSVDALNLDFATDTFAFPDTGLYKVALRIQNTDHTECVDSSSRMLSVLPTPIIETEKIKPGNVFVPNIPGGQFYIIEPEDPGIVLSFEVFTRTGVQVYKTESPSVYWDGRTNDGRQLNSGVYFYVLQATQGDPTGYYTTSGFIHIFLNVQ
jgi:hypothetical protein